MVLDRLLSYQFTHFIINYHYS